jgi:hypothetical protein
MADEMNGERVILKLRDVLDEARSYIGAPTFSPSMDAEAASAVEQADQYLAGRASLAANAGSEPVAWALTEQLTKRETTTRGYLWFSDPVNCMWTPLYTHPSPPEGMAVTDAMIDAGKKMLHNSNGRGAREKVERIFNAMIAAAPPLASEAKGAT